MKQLAVFAISGYQIFISPLFRIMVGQNTACRYSPTCSEYTKNIITSKGVINGSYLAIKRILSCQPFSKAQINIYV